MSQRARLPFLFLHFVALATGMIVRNRVSAAGWQLLAIVAFVVALILFSSAETQICRSALVARNFSQIAAVATGAASFAAGLWVGSATLRTLYAHDLFDTYEFFQKAQLAAVLAIACASLAGAGVGLQMTLMASSCMETSAFAFALFRYVAVGASSAVLLLALKTVAGAVALRQPANPRELESHLDLALRVRSSADADRPAGSMQSAPREPPATITRLFDFAKAQFRANNDRTLRLFVLVAFLVLAGIFAVGTYIQDYPFATWLLLGAMTLSVFEAISAPELIHEPRIAYSGQPFAQNFLLMLAPFLFGSLALALLAYLLTDAPFAAACLWIATTISIATRFLMRVAWFGAQMQAARDTVGIAVFLLIGFQLLGSIVFVGLAGIPFYLYFVAQKRVGRP